MSQIENLWLTHKIFLYPKQNIYLIKGNFNQEPQTGISLHDQALYDDPLLSFCQQTNNQATTKISLANKMNGRAHKNKQPIQSLNSSQRQDIDSIGNSAIFERNVRPRSGFINQMNFAGKFTCNNTFANERPQSFALDNMASLQGSSIANRRMVDNNENEEEDYYCTLDAHNLGPTSDISHSIEYSNNQHTSDSSQGTAELVPSSGERVNNNQYNCMTTDAMLQPNTNGYYAC